jgi:Rieske Fe-S protein
MPGEDQERFEDYLELEHYLEELQAGRDAQLPGPLTPEKARIYRMATLLRSVSAEAEQPRPEFAAELQARLEQELEQQDPTEVIPAVQQKPANTTQHAQPITRHRPNVSRRALLTGSAAVAASLAVGAGIGATAEQKLAADQAAKPPQAAASVKDKTPAVYSQLIASGAGHWLAVTPFSTLGKSAMRFSSDTLVGYIIRPDEDDGVTEPVVAFSAACTHMGCIVKWQDADRKFHCPCHGGLFTEYGEIDNNASKIHYLSALPRLRTKIENGIVFVEVPNSLSTNA